MQSMNISLPDPLKQFVDGRSPKAGIAAPANMSGNSSAPMKSARPRMSWKRKLPEGLKSSKTALTVADWKEIRAEALTKMAARKKPR